MAIDRNPDNVSSEWPAFIRHALLEQRTHLRHVESERRWFLASFATMVGGTLVFFSTDPRESSVITFEIRSVKINSVNFPLVT